MASNQSGGWWRKFSSTSPTDGFADLNWMTRSQITPHSVRPEHENGSSAASVSYTHLEVYKRQVFSPQVRLESLFGSKQNAKMNELRVIKLLCQKEHRSFLFSPEFLKMLHDVAQEHDDKVEPLFELSNFANTSCFVLSLIHI